jgi:GNAT superfamily N-acetyltransferase
MLYRKEMVVGILVLSRDIEPEHGPRPLDVMRDLDGIGRLIDIAFAGDMGRDGAAVRRDLALLMAASPLMWGLRTISPEFRDAFDGFVWVEDGRIVGNVTLTRDDPAHRVWTVTNVAVHPTYRRRGIARAMMLMCLDAVQRRGGGPVVLEVKHDNDAAYRLYNDLGFTFVDGSVTATHSGRITQALPAHPSVRGLSSGEWRRLFDLAVAARSSSSQRITPLRAAAFQPTVYEQFGSWLATLLRREQRFTLAIEDGARLVAAARGRCGPATAAFDVIIHPDQRGQFDEAIVSAALQTCMPQPANITVRLDSADEASWRFLQSLRFEQTRHLHRLVLDVEA